MDRPGQWVGSPHRHHRYFDEESGGNRGSGNSGAARGDDSAFDNTFEIPAKNASIERLRRWRQAALVLNASRRFRYTLDLKKEGEKEQIRRKIRTHAQLLGIFLIIDHLAPLIQEIRLKKFLRTSCSSLQLFLWEAWQDLTLVILMIAAAVSLVLGIKTEVDFHSVLNNNQRLDFFSTAVSDYRQSLRFQNLNAEKRNIHLEVCAIESRDFLFYLSFHFDVSYFKHLINCVWNFQVVRGGRRIEVSIFDLVVGDVIPLKIGDQVPADGLFISGYSLAIDESSMTGESKIVHKNLKAPFLMSGCKVADGYGTMLVTAVGINTEWGLLMASISEDTGEETPLQVRLNGVATFIGIVGLSVAFVVLIVLFARYGFVHCSILNVTIVVVAVPEGLPLAVTLTLAYSMRKMMADKALARTFPFSSLGSLFSDNVIMDWALQVRRLSACETMGSATTICKRLSQFFPFLFPLYLITSSMQAGSGVNIHWKGAAEIVLSSCTGWLEKDGSVKPMDDDRVDIHFLLLDPCRPGVKDAVRLCTHAGVKVRMVTGDNIQTAKAIALECGILDSGVPTTEPTIIEGRTFRAYSATEREEIAGDGRSSPNDKLLLVQALRKRGHVVAVTGDGTNDAPALHEADIGLAMGIQGTEVAKESSDIIILDDNFASVVKVVRWGRSVYANIQKFIQFQLTVNVAALVINVVAALLWVNLIMDTLGALALATEPPTDHLMDRPPVGRRESLITNIMWRNLLVQSTYQVIILLTLNFDGKNILRLNNETREHADKLKNTFIFNTFVLCQVFNEFNARKPDEFNVFAGVTKNYLFIGIVGMTVVLQVRERGRGSARPSYVMRLLKSFQDQQSIYYWLLPLQILIIEFLGKFTSTVRLNWKFWLISLALASVRYNRALFLPK
ncbi:unnamed protein product [Spirodela intermedia]|uniref:P-type Ca(2+) transporter n=1 Tax=Spirodela intermedia TaxID=51605 RepID=A0A7I8JKI3_SPIIN|nr:unnamed protein product [Spirodela intermedia]CAA6670351.1 unnamed protein product [Spirodela intermedia]